jgi:hypothetical protein
MAKAFPNTGVTIIDSSSDLPAASAALEGVLMFQKDSNELKICDGANWRSVIDTDRPPGIELIQPTSVDGGTNNNGAVTYSSVSGVRLNGVFSSVHDNYRVIVDNTAGTAGAYLQMRFSTNGADYTASNYYLGGGYSGITGTQGFYGGAAAQNFLLIFISRLVLELMFGLAKGLVIIIVGNMEIILVVLN